MLMQQIYDEYRSFPDESLRLRDGIRPNIVIFAAEMLEKLIRFCIVGGSGLLIDFGVTYLFKEWLRVNKYVANSLGFICAATSNYFFNRRWTFHSADPNITRQYLVFVGIALIGLAINNAIVYLAGERLKLNFYLSKLIAIGVVTFWNFFMNYIFNF